MTNDLKKTGILPSKWIKPDDNDRVEIEKSSNGKYWQLKKANQEKPKYRLSVKAFPNISCLYKEFMDVFYDPGYAGLNSLYQDKKCVNLHILKIAQTPEYAWWACGPMRK